MGPFLLRKNRVFRTSASGRSIQQQGTVHFLDSSLLLNASGGAPAPCPFCPRKNSKAFFLRTLIFLRPAAGRTAGYDYVFFVVFSLVKKPCNQVAAGRNRFFAHRTASFYPRLDIGVAVGAAQNVHPLVGNSHRPEHLTEQVFAKSKGRIAQRAAHKAGCAAFRPLFF